MPQPQKSGHEPNELGASELPRHLHEFASELDYVYRTLRRYGVPAADAEDVAQEVFLIAWRRRNDFDSSRPLRPWLGGIAFKLAHQYHGKRRPALLADLGTDPGAEESVSPDALEPEAIDARALVLRVLAKLPARHREVLVAHELDGVSVDDIAARWQVPRFTLYTRLRRARQAFADEVNRLRGRGKQRVPARALAPGSLLTLKRDAPAPPPDPRWGRWWLGLVATMGVIGSCVLLVVARPDPPSHEPASNATSFRAGRTGRREVAPPVRLVPAPQHEQRSASDPAPTSLARDLFGHWRFEDGRGSVTAVDQSPGHRTCALRRLEPARVWIPGAVGGGLELGFGGWLECPQPALPRRATAAFSVALWVKRAGSPHHHRALVTRRMDASSRNYFFFGFDGDQLTASSSGWSGTLAVPFHEPPGKWVHVAFSHDTDRTVKLYIAGQEVARQQGSARIFGATAQPLRVGGGLRGDTPEGVGQLFEGAVDELLVYGRALDPTEIAALAARVTP